MIKRLFFLFVSICSTQLMLFGQTKTIHVYVALCDNEHQGIVPVPAQLGDGKDPGKNLYWGAAFGLKSYFRYKTKDWELVKTVKVEKPIILERVLYKHKTADVFMLADAYDGEKIKECVEDFLKASNSQGILHIVHESSKLEFGGGADLVAYAGHDGLMDFEVNIQYNSVKNPKDIIILACYSKEFFSSEIKKAQATPLLWTTHLMAPEAYTLKSAIGGWILDESGEEIKERAAQAYHKYQKCGINGARNLFTTGF